MELLAAAHSLPDFERHERFRDGNGLQLVGGSRRKCIHARNVLSRLLPSFMSGPLGRYALVAFKINLHAKHVSSKKSKMSLHSWATVSGQLQACLYTDFLYISRNAILPRRGARSSDGPSWSCIEKGCVITWPITTNYGWGMGSVSPILGVTGCWQ